MTSKRDGNEALFTLFASGALDAVSEPARTPGFGPVVGGPSLGAPFRKMFRKGLKDFFGKGFHLHLDDRFVVEMDEHKHPLVGLSERGRQLASALAASGVGFASPAAGAAAMSSAVVPQSMNATTTSQALVPLSKKKGGVPQQLVASPMSGWVRCAPPTKLRRSPDVAAKLRIVNERLAALLRSATLPRVMMSDVLSMYTLRYKQRIQEACGVEGGVSARQLFDERFEMRKFPHGQQELRLYGEGSHSSSSSAAPSSAALPMSLPAHPASSPAPAPAQKPPLATSRKAVVRGVPVTLTDDPVEARDAVDRILSSASDKMMVVFMDFERDAQYNTTLAQMRFNDEVFLFDVKSSPELFFGPDAPMRQLLGNASVCKVIHDCRADVMHLSSRQGVQAFENVIDTQVMLDVVFSKPRTSLVELIEQAGVHAPELGDNVDRTSWQTRPLTEHHVSCAALEVVLLKEALSKLHAQVSDRWVDVVGGSTKRVRRYLREPIEKPPPKRSGQPKHGMGIGYYKWLAFLNGWQTVCCDSWEQCLDEIRSDGGDQAVDLDAPDADGAQPTADEEAFLAVLPPTISRAISLRSLSGNYPLKDLVDVTLDNGDVAEALYRDAAGTTSAVQLTEVGAVTLDDIQHVLTHEAVSEVDASGRASIEGTLHRVGVISTAGKAIGLTLKVGHSLVDPGHALADLLRGGKSVLIVGRAGVGKSTLMRGMARMLADAPLNHRTMLVDSSGDVAGRGALKHPAIGRARRVPVDSKKDQAQLLEQVVVNHTPEAVVVDQIKTAEEADSMCDMAELGIQVVAGVRGSGIADIARNPALRVLLGVDASGQRVLQPAFDVCVEVHGHGNWLVHKKVTRAVDSTLGGKLFPAEQRTLLRDGEHKPYTVEGKHEVYPMQVQEVWQQHRE